MSLEKAIDANTAALIALTAKLTAASMVASAELPPKAAAEAAQRSKPAAPAGTPAPVVVGTGETTVGGVTRESLKAKVVALAGKDEPRAVAIMTKYGGKLPATKPEDYVALDAELTAALSPAAPASLV